MQSIRSYGTRAMRFPFCAFIITHLVGFVKGFFYFFSRFLLAPKFLRVVPIPTLRSRPLGVLSLPLTLIIILILEIKSTIFLKKIAQKRDNYFIKICANFLLTNCWGLWYNNFRLTQPKTASTFIIPYLMLVCQ